MRKNIIISLLFTLLASATYAEIVYTFPGGITGSSSSGIKETFSLPEKSSSEEKDLAVTFYISDGYSTGWDYGIMFGLDVNEDGDLGIEEVALEFYPGMHVSKISNSCVIPLHPIPGAESCRTWYTRYNGFESNEVAISLTIPRFVFRSPVPGDPEWSFFRTWNGYYQCWLDDPFHPSQWNTIRLFAWGMWAPPFSVTIGWVD